MVPTTNTSSCTKLIIDVSKTGKQQFYINAEAYGKTKRLDIPINIEVICAFQSLTPAGSPIYILQGPDGALKFYDNSL